MIPPIPMRWDGEVFKPLSPGFAKLADKHYIVGERYQVEIREERSGASHSHFFAAVTEAHRNLPDHLAERWPTADHLRKWCLIKTGFHDERSIVCASKAEAQRVAAFVKPMDGYAVVVARGSVVIVWTAKSQSMKAMGKQDFQRSKDAVLEELARLIDVAPAALQKHASAA